MNSSWVWAVCELDNQCHLARAGSWQPPANNTPDPNTLVDPYWNYGPDPNDRDVAVFPYHSYLERILREGSPRKIFILQRVLRWIYVGTILELPELQLSAAEMCDFLSILLLYRGIEDSQSKAQVNEQEVADIGGQLIRKSPDATTFEFMHHTVEGYLTVNISKDKQQFKLDDQVVDSDVIDELDIVSAQLAKGGRLAESEAMKLRLIPCRERLWGPSGNPVLAAFNNLATFYKDQGRIDEAEELYTRALRGYEKAEKPNQEAMFNTISNLGILYKVRGQFRAAEARPRWILCTALASSTRQKAVWVKLLPFWERYLQGREKLYGPNDARTLIAVFDLGGLYYNQDRIDKAIPLMERALEGYERTRGDEDKLTIQALDKLGTMYAINGRYEEAEAILKRGARGHEKLLGAEHDGTVRTKITLAKVYMQQDRLPEAVIVYREVLEGYQKTPGPDHASTGEVCSILADLYQDMGQLHDAEVMAAQALQIYEKSLGAGDILTVDTAAGLGLLYAKQGQLDMAELMWERAVRGFEEIKGPDHPSTLRQMHNLGRIYKMQFRLAEAKATLERAFEGAMRALGPEDSLTQRIGGDLASLYENLGQMDEVIQVSERLSLA
ncbi:hypothetical protein N7519_007508 [Penicillium mononematosum]|uniref:uncharacterized protein n=1 Tax=Penicillium mononematosum TaxID=268346 RepID=UPI002546B2A4|nr:uncharacterized protein N7519_007508 [Penicillium mononematosum]KAJ6186207.1 hypothetical protein N7519_007508 [Penicillium mononematosum]